MLMMLMIHKMRNHDPYDLNRFVEAQASNYSDALAELRDATKRTHWSWYIFPQIRGLGSSPTSVRFAISSLAEAVAYLGHEVLGPRLRECVTLMNSHHGLSANDILGDIDAQKFQSCLTLFAQAAPSEQLFKKALNKYFGGDLDAATLKILAKQLRLT
jgi:uncharacterized protein (DUF1810 family)